VGQSLECGGISVELDDNLVDLQRQIIRSTGVEFDILDGDACKTNFEKMNLSRPLFLISGLPEHGEVLADAVISNLIQQEFLPSHIGFALMGSHTMKKYARDRSLFGWGRFIAAQSTCFGFPYFTDDVDQRAIHRYTVYLFAA
jgi:hypothetical protein